MRVSVLLTQSFSCLNANEMCMHNLGRLYMYDKGSVFVCVRACVRARIRMYVILYVMHAVVYLHGSVYAVVYLRA